MRSQILSVTANLKLLFRECTVQANSLIILAATFFIFFIDLNLPLGVAAGVPYALVIFASLWVNGIQFTYLVTALGLLFTVIKFYLLPISIVPIEIVQINRGLILLLIVCTTIMVTRIKKANIDMSALMNQIPIDPITGIRTGMLLRLNWIQRYLVANVITVIYLSLLLILTSSNYLAITTIIEIRIIP
jgi:hypothetical protein